MPPSPFLLAELQKLRRERSEASPFASHDEFLRWTDQVEPLLQFQPSFLASFLHSVNAAKMVHGSRHQNFRGVNEAVATVNKAIAHLELELKSPPAPPVVVATQARTTPAADVPAQPKVTLKWVYEHASWTVYATFLGAVVASFAAGREVGKLETHIQSSTLSKPAPMTIAPTPATTSNSELIKPTAKLHIASSPQ